MARLVFSLTINREAIEDFTGGVSSEILSSNILDKDKFWKDELMKVNKEFLFGCGTGIYSNWLDPKYDGPPRDRKGISENHSYSIMDAKEIDGERLLRVRYALIPKTCKETILIVPETHGERRNGAEHGAMDQSNGHRNGWRNWDISLGTMGCAFLVLRFGSFH